MTLRFWYESAVGGIWFASVLLFGAKGMVSMTLLALLPVVVWKTRPRLDERELLLFYKAGNLTMGLVVLSLVLIHFCSGVVVNGHAIGANWMLLSVASLVAIHGLSGLGVFRWG